MTIMAVRINQLIGKTLYHDEWVSDTYTTHTSIFIRGKKEYYQFCLKNVKPTSWLSRSNQQSYLLAKTHFCCPLLALCRHVMIAFTTDMCTVSGSSNMVWRLALYNLPLVSWLRITDQKHIQSKMDNLKSRE